MHNENNSTAINKGYYEKFAGSEKCAECHKNIYDDFVHTAHFATSAIATEKSIKGSFENGHNKYFYNNSVAIAMEKRNDSFYQVEYYKETEKKAKRFDIVVGSGTMGQSFLSWRDNNLFQLPITFFTAANLWANSPGFPDKILFNRPITSRCLECHSTYINTISDEDTEPEEFAHNQIIYGVSCEKCHGPSANHVEFQTKNPKETKGKFIINPATFTRQQKLDMCTLCHGGRLQKTRPSFEFIAGDTLSNYFLADTTMPDPKNIDVHGNQYGLLRASKCFKISTTLTCNTCHNTHENERGNTAIFSQRCITCHNNEHGNICKMTHSLGKIIKTNCIDCHMPLKSSKVIAVQLHGDSIPIAASIRSHFISIYPEQTNKVITFMKNVSK